MKTASHKSAEGLNEPLSNAKPAAIQGQVDLGREGFSQTLSAEDFVILTQGRQFYIDMRKAEWHPREWSEEPLNLIDHGLACLLEAASSSCCRCGGALGTGQLAAEPSTRLCLVCQRNC